jgi:hypothetical protein
MRAAIPVVVAALLALTLPAKAIAGTRADHWSGFDFAAGMPFPSLGGAMLGFNINDDARIAAGVGTFGNWVTYQLDFKFFLGVAPWTTYFGAGFNYMNGHAGDVLLWSFQFSRAFVPYMEAGIDFQSDVGVHVMFNLGGSAPNGHTIVMPGVAVGWYF